MYILQCTCSVLCCIILGYFHCSLVMILLTWQFLAQTPRWLTLFLQLCPLTSKKHIATFTLKPLSHSLIKSTLCLSLLHSLLLHIICIITHSPGHTHTYIPFTHTHKHTTYSEKGEGPLGALVLAEAIQQSEYSYFSPSVLAMWAGPKHWRIQPKVNNGKLWWAVQSHYQCYLH